ncbi:MAG: hypothetical protein ACK4UZ_12610, partial [Rhizobium rhizophilum]
VSPAKNAHPSSVGSGVAGSGRGEPVEAFAFIYGLLVAFMSIKLTYSLASIDSKMPESKTLTIRLTDIIEFHSIWNNAETKLKKSTNRA